MLTKQLARLLRATLFAFVLCDCASGQTEKKASFIIMLDNTGSMTSQFKQVVMLGKEVVKRVSQRGEVSIVNYKTHDLLAVATRGFGWTKDEDALNDYIDGLTIVRGHTTFFEGVEWMAAELDAKVGSNKSTEKIVILITDGEDKIRRHQGMNTSSDFEDDERKKLRNQLIKKLKISGIKVYAVGLTGELASSSLIQFSRRDKAETLLKKLTKDTGGRAVFVQSKKPDIGRLLDELLAP